MKSPDGNAQKFSTDWASLSLHDESPELSDRKSNLKYAVVYKLTGFDLDIQP